jgi:predicted GIY-YIG superfamily endonuclease
MVGLAMGSPVTGIVANLHMEMLEEDLQRDLPIWPRLWRRSTDDIFVLWDKSHQEFEKFIEAVTFRTTPLTYTWEKEDNNVINYLDLQITKEENYFKFNVYRKPTATGSYLNFTSNHPIETKLGVIDTLLARANRLTTAPDDLQMEIAKVIYDLRMSGYPSPVLEKRLQKATLNTIWNKTDHQTGNCPDKEPSLQNVTPDYRMNLNYAPAPEHAILSNKSSLSLTLGDEEFLIIDDTEILTQLKLLNLREVPIKGDGNCLFRALAHQSLHSQEAHQVVRHRITEHLDNSFSSYHDFLHDGMTKEEVINDTKQLGHYGWGLHVKVWADLESIEIIVLSEDGAPQHFTPSNIINAEQRITLIYRGRAESAEAHYNSTEEDTAECLGKMDQALDVVPATNPNANVLKSNLSQVNTLNNKWPYGRKITPFPYVPGVSQRIRKHLRPFGIETVFRRTRRLRDCIFKTKLSTDLLKQKGVVYKIPCECGEVYIGQTKRPLSIRLAEHKRQLKGCCIEKSELANHAWTKQHRILFPNTSIIAKENNFYLRVLKESLLIKAYGQKCFSKPSKGTSLFIEQKYLKN